MSLDQVRSKLELMRNYRMKLSKGHRTNVGLDHAQTRIIAFSLAHLARLFPELVHGEFKSPNEALNKSVVRNY
jgi:hypothetical protein